MDLLASWVAATANQQSRLLSGNDGASIVRGLLKPSILLCDEPTRRWTPIAASGHGILKRIAIEEQRVTVVVSHDSRVFHVPAG